MSRGLQDTCECCTDQFGWIWNLDDNTAEPCPVCNGAGELDHFVGSTAWDNNGAEPVVITEACRECAGTGTVYPAFEPAKRNERPVGTTEIAELPF